MKRKKIAISVLSFLFLIILALSSESLLAKQKKHIEEKTLQHKEPHETVLLLRNAENVPLSILKKFTRQLRARMKRLPYSDFKYVSLITSTDDYFGTDCSTVSCLIKEGRTKGVHRIIIYDIKFIERDNYRALDKKGAGQYLLQLHYYDRVVCTISLIDVPSRRVLSRVNRTMKVNEYGGGITTYYNRFKPYYKARVINEKLWNMFWTASMNLIKPFGEYGEEVLIAGGFKASIGAMDLFKKGLDISFQAGIFDIRETKDRVDFYYGGEALAHVGYRIDYAPDIIIIPGCGFGYRFHYISDTIDDTKEFLYNPMIVADCSLAYFYQQHHAFIVGIGVGMFFDEDSTGIFSFTNLGIRKHF